MVASGCSSCMALEMALGEMSIANVSYLASVELRSADVRRYLHMRSDEDYTQEDLATLNAFLLYTDDVLVVVHVL